ncbi:MAG: PAS domain S-box protein [Planctomycetota bacterium]|jgi:PAS domain S-box-containing protein
MPHNNKEWFQAILSSLHETSIIVLDKEGYIVSLWGTPEMDRRYGLPASDVVGKSVKEILPPEQVKQTLKLIQHIFDTREKLLVEQPVTLPGGTFWQETSLCPMMDNSDNIIGVVGVIRDITKRKRAEDELRISEEKYRRLIESLQDNFFLYSHNTEGVFTYISPSITNVLGYSQEELLAHFSKYMTDNPSNEKVIKHTGLSLKGIKQPSYEVEIYHNNGSVRTLKVQEVPVFDEEGNVIAVEGIAEDITGRKKMEEALLQSEKLKSLGIITSGIAHEFNNVLAIIKGNAHLLKKRCGNPEKMEQCINGISNAVEDGTEIVRMMDEFVHTKRDSTDFIPINMSDIVKQTIDLTRPRWKDTTLAKEVIYDIDIEGIKEVATVMGNPSELKEALVNIIDNALDTMYEGGRLSFRTWEKDDTVFVSISDTGEGMGEDVQKRIFDPFFSTRSPKGKGLGMSISYSIITRHDGKIDVESERGKGSTFTIGLPRKM